MPAPPSLPRSSRRAVRSFLWRFRPGLVALLVAVAAWSTVGALTPAPPASTAVLVPVADLPAGHLLQPQDLTTLELPDAAVPPSALTDAATTAGSRLAHPAARGVPLTPSALVAPTGWSGVADDELVVPVRLADPAVAALLPPATPLHLVSATGTGSTLLTSSARLLASVGDVTGASLLGTPDQGGILLLLAVPREVATLVLDASAGGTLSVALGAGG